MAEPHKWSALRLNIWPTGSEGGFICGGGGGGADISSPFKWHQTGRHAVLALQVAKRAGAASDSSTKPDGRQAKDRISSKWFIIIFGVSFFCQSSAQMARHNNFIKARRIQASFVI